MARLALTAPRPRILALAAALRDDGHEVLELPFTEIESLAGEPAQRVVLADLPGFDLAVFVSPTAIDVFVEALEQGWPDRLRAAIVGPGSLEALAAHGLDTRPGLLMPAGPVFDAAGLLALPALAAPCSMRVLVVRADGGNRQIEQTLAERGARVTALAAYRRQSLAVETQARATLARWSGTDLSVVVTTVDAARSLGELADGPDGIPSLREARMLAIHPRIAECLRHDGWPRVDLIAPGLAALRGALESVPGAGEGSPQRSGSECD